MVKQLTHKRVQALNELALAGEADVIAHWADRFGIPIDGTDDEIRRAVLGSGCDVTLKTARAAADRLRRSQDARAILLVRYPPTSHATEDVSFAELEASTKERSAHAPSRVKKGLYFYRGSYVSQTGRRRRAGTIRFRTWQIGQIRGGVFVPDDVRHFYESRAAALYAIDERRDS